VARLVASGLSNREAAAQLYLSPKTVEYHLAHAFAKLGVRSRHQLTTRIRDRETQGVPLRGNPGRSQTPTGQTNP
jgi:DNA-binding CsgD family transcriptional regulator